MKGRKLEDTKEGLRKERQHTAQKEGRKLTFDDKGAYQTGEASGGPSTEDEDMTTEEHKETTKAAEEAPGKRRKIADEEANEKDDKAGGPSCKDEDITVHDNDTFAQQ